jgi:hypothetical protein
MAEKNGGDIGAVYQAVQSLAGEMHTGFAEVRQEMRAGFADVRQEVTEPRQTLTDYHSAVLGDGILISDVEAWVRRLERHVGLSPEG